MKTVLGVCGFLMLIMTITSTVLGGSDGDQTGLLTDEVYLTKLRPTHPRLFFNSDTLPELRHQARENNPEALDKLRRMVDALPDDAPYIELTELFSRDEQGRITPVKPGGVQGCLLLKYAGGVEAAQAALLYALTEETQYRDKALKYLELYIKALQFSRDGYWYIDLTGHTRINAMLAYDILYNDLTEEKRRELMLPLVEYVRDTQEKGKLNFRRTIGSYRDGNYGEPALEYFLGLTLYGDGIADAEAEAMLKRGMALFVRMMDFRDETAAGSGLLSSLTTAYAFGAYPVTTHLFFYSYNSAFGEDVSGRWKQMLDYHTFVKGMTFLPNEEGAARLHGIGDMDHKYNRHYLQYLYTHFVHNIHFYQAQYPEKTAQMYEFLQVIPPERRVISIGSYPMFPFLATGFDSTLIDQGKSDTSAGYYYTPKFGFLTMWSGRGEEDTYAGFRFGSSEGNHQHYDELSFVLFKHDYLALDSGSRTETDHHHNFASQSVAHNTLLIHQPDEPMAPFWKSWSHVPDGQTYYNHGGQNTKNRAKALALHDTPEYLYAAGDATLSYDTAKSREVIRQFVYLKPDIFIIYDRVASVEATQKKEFLLHTMSEPVELSHDLWQADQGKGRLMIRTLLPEKANISKVGGPGKEFFASGRNWPLEENIEYLYAGKWRLEVTTAQETAQTRFLHILECTNTDDSTPEQTELKQSAEEDIVIVDDYEFHFRRDGEVGLKVVMPDQSLRVHDNIIKP